VGSLFSGIGGIDLGLERAGMRVVWQSEVDPFCCRVLARHWPDVPNLGDVTTIDWSGVERPDLVCGGYPCQPFSFAGSRGGAADPRHLWPHMARCLRVLRPRWALLENVPGHLGLGFADVLADLAALGFDAEWDLLPAAAFGAPHLRYRLFVVAHADQGGEPDGPVDAEPWFGLVDVADAPGARRPGPFDAVGGGGGRPLQGRQEVFGGRREPERCSWWDVEPDVGRVAHGVPHRVDRLRALGNAVVPQVAEWVGRRIVEAAS
jgi:DNA (cytosine-5)-methyltransferase 1